jgi:hypothetical protein
VSGLLLGKVGAVLVVAGGSAGITWAATGSGSEVITNAGPAAWIDDPLDGSVLPSDAGEVTVVAHATDPDGIVEIVLTVDGADLDSADTGGDDLETADDLRWTPRGPGTYELRVIGRDTGGATTPPGIAVVQVGTDEEQPATTTTTTLPDGSTVPEDSTSSSEAALESTTTAPGATTTTRPVTGTTATTAPATTTPGATTTTTRPVTTTTCVPDAPVNTSPFHGESVGTRTPTLAWAYRGCTPALFRIVVTPGPELAPIEAGATVAGTEQTWETPVLACGTHWFHVRAESGPNVSAWSQATSFTLFARVC